MTQSSKNKIFIESIKNSECHLIAKSHCGVYQYHTPDFVLYVTQDEVLEAIPWKLWWLIASDVYGL